MTVSWGQRQGHAELLEERERNDAEFGLHLNPLLSEVMVEDGVDSTVSGHERSDQTESRCEPRDVQDDGACRVMELKGRLVPG